MKTIWTKGLDADKAADLKAAFQASTVVRSRLKEILHEKEASKMSARTSEKDYESPNWALLQADAVGYTRCLKEILSIIS
jgi:hypothetical protein